MALAIYTLYRFRQAVLTFFILDDFWVMRDAHRVQIGSLWDLQQFFWFGHQGFRLYRPFTTTAYSYVLQSLFGFDPSGHHAFQLVVFTLNVLLIVGIVRRLTDSAVAGLSAGLLYLLAPGQAVNAYWLSAFTVSGTALWILFMLWCWLTLRGWTRGVVCTLLQVCGLLASEHAIAAPVLCAIVTCVRREPWRRAGALLVPSVIIVAVYSISKLLYLHAARTFAGGYSVNFQPTEMMEQLGRYVTACFNVLAVQRFSPATNVGIGVFIIAVAVLAAWGAWRSNAAARLLAAGTGMFVVSLLPVLVLQSHYYDHYICTAALGAVIAVVGLAQLLTRQWWWAVLGFSIALLLFDVQSGEKAWRQNGILRLVVNGSLNSAAWIDAVQRATAEHSDPIEALVPIDRATSSIFAIGEAHTFLPGMPLRLTRYHPARELTPAPWQVVVKPRVLHLGQPLPYWDPRWDWVRRLAGAN